MYLILEAIDVRTKNVPRNEASYYIKKGCPIQGILFYGYMIIL